jgi:hypothetical protein
MGLRLSSLVFDLLTKALLLDQISNWLDRLMHQAILFIILSYHYLLFSLEGVK